MSWLRPESAFLGVSIGFFTTMIAGICGLYGFGYRAGSAEWRAKAAAVEARDPVLVFAKKCRDQSGSVIVYEHDEPIGFTCNIRKEIRP